MEAGGELCIVVKWLDAPAAGTINKRKIVGETQSLTLEQWKGDYKARKYWQRDITKSDWWIMDVLFLDYMLKKICFHGIV